MIYLPTTLAIESKINKTGINIEKNNSGTTGFDNHGTLPF